MSVLLRDVQHAHWQLCISDRMLLSKDIDLAKMRRRWETIRLIESLDQS